MHLPDRSPVTGDPSAVGLGRRALAWVLVVIGSALAAVGLVAVWANTLVLDEDRYVDAVGPLAREQAVQEAITTVVTNGIVDRIDPAIGVDLTRATVEKTVDSFVRSGAFRSLWTDVNRIAHAQVIALLTGTDTDILDSRDGQVVLELGPIVTAITDDLDVLGIDISGAAGAAADIEIPIVTETGLEPAQRWVRRLERAAFWFPLAALAALGLSLWASPQRWRMTGRMGVGLGLSGLVVLLAILVARALFLDQTADTVPDVVAERLYDRLVDPLQASGMALLAIAAALAVAGFAGGAIAARLRRASR